MILKKFLFPMVLTERKHVMLQTPLMFGNANTSDANNKETSVTLLILVPPKSLVVWDTDYVHNIARVPGYM